MAGYNPNMYPYYDQGDIGGPPAPLSYSTPPPYDPAMELRQGDWTNEGLSKEILKLLAPNITRGDRPPLESAILDAGQFLPTPERGAMLAKEGIPLAAGMIRWGGGKEYPNAMLHRAIGDPKELDWWSKLFQRGRSSQAPSSVVTPSVLQTFRSEPYGLLFNVNDPSQIKAAGANDLWSKVRPSVSTEQTNKRYSNAYNKLSELGREDDVLGRLAAKWDKNSREGSKEWVVNPNSDWLIDPSKAGLDDLLGNMLENIWQLEPKGRQLIHSEVIPEIDRSMLAGVRLPFSRKDIPVFSDIPTEVEPGVYRSRAEDMVRALYEFAQQQNVPVYRWPVVETIDQEIKGLSGDPFRGKWGWKPGSREYKTTSQLPEIFGIRDLP